MRFVSKTALIDKKKNAKEFEAFLQKNKNSEVLEKVNTHVVSDYPDNSLLLIGKKPVEEKEKENLNNSFSVQTELLHKIRKNDKQLLTKQHLEDYYKSSVKF